MMTNPCPPAQRLLWHESWCNTDDGLPYIYIGGCWFTATGNGVYVCSPPENPKRGDDGDTWIGCAKRSPSPPYSVTAASLLKRWLDADHLTYWQLIRDTSSYLNERK